MKIPTPLPLLLLSLLLASLVVSASVAPPHLSVLHFPAQSWASINSAAHSALHAAAAIVEPETSSAAAAAAVIDLRRTAPTLTTLSQEPFAAVQNEPSEDVCRIPSAPASQSRESVLAELARGVADALNPAVDPCSNFYQFACGGWLAKNNQSTMPADKSSWSKSFSVIDERNERILREILQCAALRQRKATRTATPLLQLLPVTPAPSSDTNGALHLSGPVIRDRPAALTHPLSGVPPLRLTSPSPAESDELQLGRFYAACMNADRINATGLAPLRPILSRIAAIDSYPAVLRESGALARDYLLSNFFSFGVGVNPNDPTRYIVNIAQGGFPFPSREMLVGPTNVTAAYAAHISRMLQLTGDDAPQADLRASRIVNFQTAIAQFTWPVEQLRVPETQNNPMPIANLSANSSLDFHTYLSLALDNSTLSPDLIINVAQPDVIAKLGALIHSTPLPVLQEVMSWSALLSFASDLPEEFGAEVFRFFGKFMSGTPKQPPRWKRCQAEAVGAMVSEHNRVKAEQECDTDATNALYVKVAFTPRTESLARELMRLLQLAFLRRLPELGWMTAEDKLKAADKITAMTVLVGTTAPSKRLNYTTVHLSPDDHFGNIVALRLFNFNDTKSKLWKTVDREIFQMPASMVNAYYDPTLNSINFPAGILQPPFFSEHFPTTWNYAAIGAVVGHELTHGFDDEGRKYDRSGRLHPWWSNATAAAFANASSCLVAQYSAFNLTQPTSPSNATASSPPEHIRGFLTLGENIADQGGVTLSWLAMLSKLAAEQKRAVALGAAANGEAADGDASPYGEAGGDAAASVSPALADMQRVEPRLRDINDRKLFFLGYAQSWCRVVRPEAFQRSLQYDPHSPSEARVNVPLSNFAPFRETFDCAPRPNEAAAESCVVW